ncbi:Rha family transcriptional regulator [Massilia sp. CCM 8734]|uniref:Rha family transcriptional regulator n=1 Tax=Massilia sp. CCM 8734 TaxID=2609283 RepID=UPI00142253F8|nr:Rha family transcriptional regulator [Massilia sp. CCM 8734]
MSSRQPHELLADAAGKHTDERFADIKVPVLNFLDFIQADGDELSTDATMVATVFKKRHDNVVRAILKLRSQLPPDRRLIFEETVSSRQNPSGGAPIETTSYRMTRDGFTLLAMGFTGRRAFVFKLAYIDAFNAMAKYIKNQRDGLRYRCMDLELREVDSKRRGSYHGKGLGARRREKQANEAEEDALKKQAQPMLDLHDPPAGDIE